MPDNQTREELASEVDQLREQRAAEIELLRQERATELVRSVDEVALNAAKARGELAAEVAYAAGAEAARIDSRLGSLDASVLRINGSIDTTGKALVDLREDIQKRFDDQTTQATNTKAEGRRLILQVFSAVLVATIGAAALIVVALINTSPAS